MFIKASDPRFFNAGSFNPVRFISEKPVNDFKFGTHNEYVSYCHKDILSVFEKNIKPKLTNLIEVDMKEMYLSKIAHMNLILSETAQDHQVWEEHRDTLTCLTKIVFSSSRRLKIDHYMQSSAQKTRAMNMFKSIFEKVDVFVTPTTACLPKKIDPRSLSQGEMDENYILMTMWFVYLANLCGLPAITINAGYSESGLPVGLMLVAPWWREDLLFSAAKSLETQLSKPMRFHCPFPE